MDKLSLTHFLTEQCTERATPLQALYLVTAVFTLQLTSKQTMERLF